ncbi:MAG: aldehyde-activating protein [Pseudohongiella sp.]|nr:MAG: aldehyde-activating protein [Pseudohongiella sp.]
MTIEIESSCECGAVRATASGKPAIQLCCHCADCQTATNLPYASIVFFRIDQVVIEGEVKAQEFIAESGSATSRDSCGNCGSVMFDRSAGFPALLGIMAQRLVEPFTFEPACHVWAASKQAGVDIPKGIKVYEKGIG